MITRLISFLKKPMAERIHVLKRKLQMISTLPFHFGKACQHFTLLIYQPDSHSRFLAHPEFIQLYNSFIAHNQINNAGDGARLWSFILNIKQVIAEEVPGDFAELGVWRGNTAAVLAHYAAKANRKVYLFDTFDGFDARDLAGIDKGKQLMFADSSLMLAQEVIGEPSNVCHFVQGYFPLTLTEEHQGKTFCVVSVDCDLYLPMKAALEYFYPRMSVGGILLLHDYSSMSWEGAKKAIDEFCAESDEYLILMPDKSGSAFLRKSKDTSRPINKAHD